MVFGDVSRSIRKKRKPEEEVIQPIQQPKPVPLPQDTTVKTAVKFNPDSTVEYTDKTGKKFNFTKDEYNSFLASQGSESSAREQQVTGGPTENVKSAVNPEARLEAERIVEAQQALSNLGLTPEQQAREFVGQKENLGSLTAELASGVAGAVSAGSVAGTLVGGPVGTVAGGLIAGAGFVGGVFVKRAFSKRNDIKSAGVAYSGSNGAYANMQYAINEVNAGRMSPQQAVDLFDESEADFIASQKFIAKETESLTASFTDAEDELVKMENIAVRIPSLRRELEVAILNPNPNAIKYSQPLSEVDLNQ